MRHLTKKGYGNARRIWMLKYSYTIVIKGYIDDKSIFIIFISYKLYSSHLSFVSIYFVPFIAKSAEIRSLFSLLLKASLKCLQSVNMRILIKRLG